jgi:hypothetical protein
MRNQPSDQRLSTASNQSYRQVIILAGVLSAFLITAAAYSVRIWGELGDIGMSSSGYVALASGVLAATAVGAGLMGLVFYSSRRGFDDGIATRASASDEVAEPDRPTAG